MGPFLYFMVVDFSLFALGATAVACVVLAICRPRRWWAYIITKAAMAGLVGVILIRVLPVRVIDLNAYSVIYIVCLMALTGFMPVVTADVIHRTAVPSPEKKD